VDRTIVDYIDVNWNELILDRIQRQTFVSVEMNLRVTTEIHCSMAGMTCCSDKIALYRSFGQSVLWIVWFVSSALCFDLWLSLGGKETRHTFRLVLVKLGYYM
jgi:hypothetical protein